MINWKKLQNGSDIRGVAIQSFPGEIVTLNPLVMNILGQAFVAWLRQAEPALGPGAPRVAVGCDSRLSGPALKAGLFQGLVQAGAQVFDCGLASTPALFMTTCDRQGIQGSIMLTASHLPFNRNGLKFFTPQGGLDKADIAAILDLAQGLAAQARVKAPAKAQAESGTVPPVQSWDFMNTYAASLTDFIRRGVNHPTHYETPLQGLHIVVDAGNGAGGFFAHKVLLPLGADIQGSQFLEPDGYFPNHVPNPEDPVAMEAICGAVRAHKAHLGIIFDTDVDRAAIVDHEGRPVNRNKLIALIGSIVLREHPGSTIVTDSITSDGLHRFLEESLGGRHHRFKRGYKNVINEALRLNAAGEACHLAIETSGHAALKENRFLDDGAYLVAKILIEVARLHGRGQDISELLEEVHEAREAVELRFPILSGDIEYGEVVLRALESALPGMEGWLPVKPNYEGIRVQCTAPQEQGWFLLRKSLHDPVMPLNIESEVEGGAEAIGRKLTALLSGCEQLGPAK